MADKPRQGIYIELDALLDTRLATLARVAGEETAQRVLETGQYHARLSDRFAGVDKDVYQAQYKNRTVDTLKTSVVTNAIAIVRQLVAALAEDGAINPLHGGAKVTVNVFPYELTVEERDEIRRALVVWTRATAPIELVSIRPEDLTPSHCKELYSAMFMYEYNPWLTFHNAALVQCPLPRVTLFAPAIYFEGEPPSAEELEEIIAAAAHPFRATQMLAAPMIGLQLIDVKHFSVQSGQDVEPAYLPTPASEAAQAVPAG
jgi:hypothetical protein